MQTETRDSSAVPDLDFPVPPFDDMQNLVRMRFLHDVVVRHARPEAGCALEIGVFKACSTVFLAKACEKVGIDRVVGLDLFTGTPSWRSEGLDTWSEAVDRLRSYDLEGRVRLVRGDSRSHPWDRPIDVLHIDGDHAFEGVMSDFLRFSPHLTAGGLVVFDDYDPWHPEVMRAVHLALGADAFEVVAVNWSDDAFGSICLRRRSPLPTS